MICPWKLCEERMDTDKGYVLTRKWGECDNEYCPYYYSNKKEVLEVQSQYFNRHVISPTIEEACMRVLEK